MNPTNIVTTGQTSLKASRGLLSALIVNKIPAGGLKVYDSAVASGPSTDTLLATLSTTASTGTYGYKCRFLKGLYILNGDAVQGSTTLTSTNVEVTDGDTVTIGTTVYTFKNTLAAAYDVKRSGVVDTTLTNLIKAINASGTPGTEYFAGTLKHPTVTAGTTITAHHFPITSIAYGTAANAIATTTTASVLSFTGATLASGAEGSAFDVTAIWE